MSTLALGGFLVAVGFFVGVGVAVSWSIGEAVGVLVDGSGIL